MNGYVCVCLSLNKDLLSSDVCAELGGWLVGLTGGQGLGWDRLDEEAFRDVTSSRVYVISD